MHRPVGAAERTMTTIRLYRLPPQGEVPMAQGRVMAPMGQEETPRGLETRVLPERLAAVARPGGPG